MFHNHFNIHTAVAASGTKISWVAAFWIYLFLVRLYIVVARLPERAEFQLYYGVISTYETVCPQGCCECRGRHPFAYE